MFGIFKRPRPKFRVYDVVRCHFPDGKFEGYMFIHARRFIRPNGALKKEWVYDGLIYGIEDGTLKYRTGGSCCSEGTLSPL
jgi:hypothetical protein